MERLILETREQMENEKHWHAGCAGLRLQDMMTERLVAVASEVARSRNEEHRTL